MKLQIALDSTAIEETGDDLDDADEDDDLDMAGHQRLHAREV